MTEYEKMHNGMIYDCLSEEFGTVQNMSHRLCDEYNALGVDDSEKKQEISREIFANDDFGCYRSMEKPIFIDNIIYGVAVQLLTICRLKEQKQRCIICH